MCLSWLEEVTRYARQRTDFDLPSSAYTARQLVNLSLANWGLLNKCNIINLLSSGSMFDCATLHPSVGNG